MTRGPDDVPIRAYAWQDMVREFHEANGLTAPSSTGMKELLGVDRKLRAQLIAEECAETVAALVTPMAEGCETDWPEVIDGLCDLIYVCLGTAVEMGINLAPFFAEVHRSNMTKVGGTLDENGKLQKPEGYQPPQIRELLEFALGKRERE